MTAGLVWVAQMRLCGLPSLSVKGGSSALVATGSKDWSIRAAGPADKPTVLTLINLMTGSSFMAPPAPPRSE
jgi:hypothetical protein